MSVFRSRRARSRASQSGVTLLETAIAVMLFGTTVLALLTLVYGVVASSASHKAHVRAGERATELAEAIDDLAYVACPEADDPLGALYQGVLDVGPNRTFDEEIESVEYLENETATTANWLPSCPALDQGAQRINVRVTTRGKPIITTELLVTKRDTRCPVGVLRVRC